MSTQLTAIPMGISAFVTWSQVDGTFDVWAKSYFGAHVNGEGERDDTDCYISLRGLQGSDVPKIYALFDKYDKDGDYDPDYEFCFGEQASVLPDCVTRGIMSEIYQGFGLQSIGKVLSIEDGVFLMENELDYSKFVTGRYEFAKAAEKRFVAEQPVNLKAPITEQIQSAATRAAEAPTPAKEPGKASTFMRL